MALAHPSTPQRTQQPLSADYSNDPDPFGTGTSAGAALVAIPGPDTFVRQTWQPGDLVSPEEIDPQERYNNVDPMEADVRSMWHEAREPFMVLHCKGPLESDKNPGRFFWRLVIQQATGDEHGQLQFIGRPYAINLSHNPQRIEKLSRLAAVTQVGSPAGPYMFRMTDTGKGNDYVDIVGWIPLDGDTYEAVKASHAQRKGK